MSARTNKPHEIVERALELSRADGCVVIADEESTANLRWAGNALTTNGVTRGRTLTVIATVDGARGHRLRGRLALGRDRRTSWSRWCGPPRRPRAAPGPPRTPSRWSTAGRASPDFTDAPAETSSDVFADFAPALGEAFARARAGGRELYGFANHELVSSYLGTSTGLRLRHDQPNGTLELNAKSPDRTRSAWAGPVHAGLQGRGPGGARRGAGRAAAAGPSGASSCPPGRYETLLPPTAVADLLIYQLWSSAARDAAEGRTVFSKPGGGTRVGERLAELPLTLRSDPNEPGLESRAVRARALLRATTPRCSTTGCRCRPPTGSATGELKRLITTRHSAGLTGLPVAPGIDNLILDGGEDTLAGGDGRRAPSAGLLLTCLWYIREVDPATLLLTGLTRDGVYLVENGEVVGEVNNFRFNESPVDLLGRATEAGRTEKTLPREWGDWFTRAAMPALRVPDFNMSSVSQGV